jgi:hypothetical protein
MPGGTLTKAENGNAALAGAAIPNARAISQRGAEHASPRSKGKRHVNT